MVVAAVGVVLVGGGRVFATTLDLYVLAYLAKVSTSGRGRSPHLVGKSPGQRRCGIAQAARAVRMSDLRSKLRLWDSLRLKGTAPPVHDSPLPLPGQITEGSR